MGGLPLAGRVGQSPPRHDRICHFMSTMRFDSLMPSVSEVDLTVSWT